MLNLAICLKSMSRGKFDAKPFGLYSVVIDRKMLTNNTYIGVQCVLSYSISLVYRLGGTLDEASSRLYHYNFNMRLLCHRIN